jgi:hypothetical protein
VREKEAPEEAQASWSQAWRRKVIRGHRVARLTLSLSVAAFVFTLAPGTASAAVAPAPAWQIESFAEPTNFAPGDVSGDDIYVVTATNSGSLPTDGSNAEITDTLPASLTVKRVEFYAQQTTEGLSALNLAEFGLCTTAPLQCSYPAAFGAFLKPLQPGQKLQMVVHVEVESNAAEGPVTNEVKISGGGAQSVSATSQNPISSQPTPFGFNQTTHVTALDGTPYTQAGGHPYEMTTTVNFNTESTPEANRILPAENYAPPEEIKDITVNFPAGLIGNPQAVPLCSNAEFGLNQCPVDSQVGTITFGSAFAAIGVVGLYNLVPAPGHAAEFGYHLPLGIGQVFTSGLRTGSDYTQRTVSGSLAMVSLRYLSFTLWGVPASPVHDYERGCRNFNQLGCPTGGGGPSGAAKLPFLSMPSSCASGPLSSSVTADGWNLKVDQTASTQLPAVDGCNQVPFAPAIEARPTTNLADSPSGLNVDLKIPQPQAPEGLASAHLKDSTVTLPPGLVVNPSAANGLQGCTEAQIDLHSEGPSNCPEASKLGKVELGTPLLDHPLPGAVYLAKQSENPFGALLAVYVAIDDPVSGVIIKLAGKITPDPQTGQLTASFEENPQQPFEDLKLNFFGGAQGALRTPATCGSYTSTSQLTPWSAPDSGPPAKPTDSFQISSGSNGGSCPRTASEEENKPRFHAGTEAPQGGVYSPFSLRLVREDGSQELKSLETTLPPGLIGRLAGIHYCSDAQIAAARQRSGIAEKASPSCPVASEVGTVDVAAGAGPTPINVSGHAYLAGPYKGAPLSLAIITPAVAGPFDLGTVAVRAALYVNPETTQVRAVSDPIPTILQGIPLDLRSVTLEANRPKFTRNPTSCNEFFFTGSALSVLNASTPLSQRFQVANCAALPFKPKLKISLKGGTKRNQNPALKAVITEGVAGEANVAHASVALPHSEFLANEHIGTVCTRPQLAAERCPAGSIYGFAKAETPLLEKPLEGPVYLGTGYGHNLPDLVADLKGQINVILHGRIDTDKEGGIRTTFESVPDAEVSKFTLEMKGGDKGLLVNSENICKKPQRAIAKIEAQNGKTANQSPLLMNSCGAKAKTGKHDHNHRHHAAR